MTGPIFRDGDRNSRALLRPASWGSSLPPSSKPEQAGICFPREDAFSSVPGKTPETAPEEIPTEPSLLPEEDEYFSFEI